MDVMIQSPDFKTQTGPAITHGFFTRNGGVSTGLYNSLNCGPGSNDDPEHITQNRKIVCDHIGCAPNKLFTLHQIHSKTCITTPFEIPKPKADAHITDEPDIALGVLTADCTPVLFYGQKDNKSPVIGAAHAGWGGAIGGVLNETIKAMTKCGASLNSIQACIGPCIAQEFYEVSENFTNTFIKENKDNEKFFIPSSRTAHLMFDLPGYCATKLSNIGVQKIHMLGIDTYSNEQNFFSYRRTTHRKEPDYGRQISVIMIKD